MYRENKFNLDSVHWIQLEDILFVIAGIPVHVQYLLLRWIGKSEHKHRILHSRKVNNEGGGWGGKRRWSRFRIYINSRKLF